MILKVLLVRPYPYLPTSQWLQSLIHLEPYAQELIAGGINPPHDVKICDLAMEENPVEIFRQVLHDYNPNLVGFGGFSSQFHINRKLAGITREILPETITCLGGIHPSSTPLDCNYPELFDFIVRGDGVSAIKNVIAALEMDKPLPESEWIIPTASSNFEKLASMPPPPLNPDGITTRPRRDLVDTSRYYCICYGQPGERVKTLFPEIACIRTSVGCPNRCSFCVVHFIAKGKYFQREVQDVVDEIASLPQEYIYFADDETFINTKRMTLMAESLMARGVKKKYLSWARSDTICNHPELFKLWKQAGLEFVYVGFESLEEENLNAYNKNATASQNREAREILRKLNLNVHAAFMINQDFEKKDFLTVQRAIKEIAPAEFAFTVYSPPPGTQEFEENRNKFICDDPCLYYDCLHTLLPTRLPLKDFYRYFTILYAMGAYRIPAKANKVKLPLRDHLKFALDGIKFGWNMYHMYREYDKKYWYKGHSMNNIKDK